MPPLQGGDELSAQLNVMPTLRPFWRRDKTMEPSRFSRFGLTPRVLTPEHGQALLTAFLEDSPVRTSALPAAAPESTPSEAVFGSSSFGLFAIFDPHKSKWRTPQCSLLEDWVSFSETWPRSGMTRAGSAFLRPNATPPTYEIASGLWPTPTVCGNYNLATAVKERFRSPNASDGFQWSNQSQSEREAKGQQVRLCHQLGAGGLLNPNWVEWLMGWPIGATGLEPLETDKFQEWQQQHSPRLQPNSTEEAA